MSGENKHTDRRSGEGRRAESVRDRKEQQRQPMESEKSTRRDNTSVVLNISQHARDIGDHDGKGNQRYAWHQDKADHARGDASKCQTSDGCTTPRSDARQGEKDNAKRDPAELCVR